MVAGGIEIKQSSYEIKTKNVGQPLKPSMMQVAVMIMGIMSVLTILLFSVSGMELTAVTADNVPYGTDVSAEPNRSELILWDEGYVGTRVCILSEETVCADLTIREGLRVGGAWIEAGSTPVFVMPSEDMQCQSMGGGTYRVASEIPEGGLGEYILNLEAVYYSDDVPNGQIPVSWCIDVFAENGFTIMSW